MRGILVLAHGSKEKSTENTLKEIIVMLKEEIKEECLLETAFLQFSDVNLEKGLDALVAKGADDIYVVPYFLFEGLHIREDIPEEINEYLDKHKDVTVKMGKTLGADRRLAMILADRVKECL